MTPTLTRRHALGALASLLAPGSLLHAAESGAWPSKALKFVVPYPAGGTPDAFTRQIADQFSKQLGAIAIVDNKPGASGLLGMRAVSMGPADSHTLAYVSSGQVTLSAVNPKFDITRELKPVVRLSASPFVLVVRADSPFKSVKDLIAAVQAKPGAITFGSAGQGSPAHIGEAHLEAALGNFKALQVPFKGAIESMNAIIGGQIDFTIGVLGVAMPLIKGGKLRALGVSTAKRVSVLPDVPTIAEATGTTYAFQSWGGFMMHASTPDAIVERAAKGLAAAMQTDAVKNYLLLTGSYADVSASPAAFGEQVQRELVAERQLVKQLGIAME